MWQSFQKTYVKPTNLALVSAICGSARFGLPDNISVELQFPADLPDVMADENQIVIAFKNLIRNARDANAQWRSA